MPAIVLFGRRTRIGGDDLLLSTSLTILFHMGQLICTLPLFLHSISESSKIVLHPRLFGQGGKAPQDDCTSESFLILLFVYALLSAVYGVFSVIVDFAIRIFARQGYPTQTEPRNSRIRRMLELKLTFLLAGLITVVALGWVIFFFSSNHVSCNRKRYSNTSRTFVQDAGVAHTVLSVLIFSQVAELGIKTLFLMRLGKSKQHVDPASLDSQDMVERKALAEQRWESCCSCFCKCLGVSSCFMFGGKEVIGSQGQFSDASRALTDIMETAGIVDVVPSDVTAAFLVLRQVQQARARKLQQELVKARQKNPEIPLSQIRLKPPEIVQGLRSSGRLLASSVLSFDEDVFVDAVANLSDMESATDRNVPTQSMYRRKSDGTYEKEIRLVLDPFNEQDMEALKEMHRYIPFAVAAYTWMMYVLDHPLSGCCCLAMKSSCLGCRSLSKNAKCSHSKDEEEDSSTLSHLMDGQGRVRGDNLCRAHRSAFLIVTGIQDADLVFLQVQNGFRDTPYSIILDHEWKRVVVTIRGTMSIEDSITDISLEPVALDQIGAEFGFNGDNQHCHKGILRGARNVHRDLMENGLLEKLLGEDSKYCHYNLHVVGHSLGAGIAVVLSYLLRKQYPSLRCTSFSPPGCTLSWELAVGCKDWCNALALDTEIVPRLSVESVEMWRDNILDIIGRIKVPKAEIYKKLMVRSTHKSFFGFLSCFYTPAEKHKPAPTDIDEILFKPEEIPDNAFQEQLRRHKSFQEEQRLARGEARAVKLFPPGNMMHIVKSGERPAVTSGLVKCLTCYMTNTNFVYTPIWIENDDLSEVIVSPRMVVDHFPHRIQKVLNMVRDEYQETT